MAKKQFEEIVLEKLSNLEGRFDGLDSRFDGLEGKFDGLEQRFDDLAKDVRRLEVLHEDTDAKIDHILEAFAPTAEKVAELDMRVTTLESATS